MTVTIELTPEIEAGLSALAKASGVPLTNFLRRVLEERISVLEIGLSPAERAEAWRSSVVGLLLAPPLSDDAISRENLYGARC